MRRAQLEKLIDERVNARVAEVVPLMVANELVAILLEASTPPPYAAGGPVETREDEGRTGQYL